MEHEEGEKRDEMFEASTRILLALREPDDDEGNVHDGAGDVGASGGKGSGPGGKVQIGERLLGFCSFRFDTEETADDDRMAEVVYWHVFLFHLSLSAPVSVSYSVSLSLALSSSSAESE